MVRPSSNPYSLNDQSDVSEKGEGEDSDEIKSVIHSIWNVETPKQSKNNILKGFTEKKKKLKNESNFQ